MKRSFFLLSLLLLSSGTAFAQLWDDFSDGDLANPNWIGDTDRFAVLDSVLRLQDSGANTSILYVPAATSLAAPTTFEWLIQLDFSPSASNFARIYLSERPLTDGATATGYYLQVGGISGADDALELYRQDANGATELLLSGTPGAVGGDPALARVRLERSPEGGWTLLADYAGGTDYQLQGTATDSTYDVLGYFGLYYRYTATRADAFYFDDLRIDPLYVDTDPPVLLGAEAESATAIRVTFNEPLDPTSVPPENFTLDNGIGNPAFAEWSAGEATVVRLELATPLVSLTHYELAVSSVRDGTGNELTGASTSFSFVETRVPAPGELIVTEMMVDPSPPVGLPNTEYVELYNRGTVALELERVGLASGGAPQLLPAYVLLPGAYVVVADLDDINAFDPAVPVIGLPSFPALSNGGDEVELYSPLGEELFRLSYTDDWYRDPSRSDGGFSLELSNVAGAADCGGLWAASQAPAGGTPGAENSLVGQPLDELPPGLVTAFFEGNTLVLRFDEQLAVAGAAISLSPDLGIAGTTFSETATELRVFLNNAPQTGTVYELTIPGELRDCAGNALGAATTILLGLPEPAVAGDIVINELLTHPAVGGADFIELFNSSQKVIDLRGMQISNEQQMTGSIRRNIQQNFLLLPGAYLAVVEDAADVASRYTTGPLLENALPTLPAEAGNVTLTSTTGTVLDAVDYSADWHSDLLDETRGVSLERIAAKGNSQDENNWFSAASTVGGATPGLPNSQSRPGEGPVADFFRLRETLVSPDGDGYQDFLQIDYETPGPGWTLRWTIFNEAGQPVRIFPRTELLAGTGSLRWDGATDEQQRTRSGIYVALLQLFNPDDGERKEKLVFAVAY